MNDRHATHAEIRTIFDELIAGANAAVPGGADAIREATAEILTELASVVAPADAIDRLITLASMAVADLAICRATLAAGKGCCRG